MRLFSGLDIGPIELFAPDLQYVYFHTVCIMESNISVRLLPFENIVSRRVKRHKMGASPAPTSYYWDSK